MAAITSGIVSALGAGAGFLATNAGAIAGVGQAYASVKGAETAEKNAAAQKDAVESQQKSDREAIQAQKAQAQKKRKGLIDKQRRQVIGAGDSYSPGQTGATGIVSPSDGGATLTGPELG